MAVGTQDSTTLWGQTPWLWGLRLHNYGDSKDTTAIGNQTPRLLDSDYTAMGIQTPHLWGLRLHSYWVSRLHSYGETSQLWGLPQFLALSINSWDRVFAGNGSSTLAQACQPPVGDCYKSDLHPGAMDHTLIMTKM